MPFLNSLTRFVTISDSSFLHVIRSPRRRAVATLRDRTQGAGDPHYRRPQRHPWVGCDASQTSQGRGFLRARDLLLSDARRGGRTSTPRYYSKTWYIPIATNHHARATSYQRRKLLQRQIICTVAQKYTFTPFHLLFASRDRHRSRGHLGIRQVHNSSSITGTSNPYPYRVSLSRHPSFTPSSV